MITEDLTHLNIWYRYMGEPWAGRREGLGCSSPLKREGKGEIRTKPSCGGGKDLDSFSFLLHIL